MTGKLIGALIAAILTLTGINTSDIENTALTSPNTEAASVHNTDGSFAFRLYSQTDKSKNCVFSPFSLKSAMAMAANGACGSTREEILSVLGYDNIESLNSDMSTLKDRYNKSGDIKLSTADSVWINATYPEINSDFSEAMKKSDTDMYREPLSSIPQKMSKWIEEKSSGLQKNVQIPIEDNFAIGFVNTTYLKAKWESRFEMHASYEDIFYNADSTESKTDFMHDIANHEVYKDSNITMLKLDYLDGEKNLSFYAAMGDENTDIEQYISKLERRRIRLSLPKFKQHSTISFNDILSDMGCRTMLSDSADFSIFEEKVPVRVTSVMQDTVIDVDEEGTEAASTTFIAAGATAVQEPPLEINFNKPFTYFIRDNDSGEILFMGRFAQA